MRHESLQRWCSIFLGGAVLTVARLPSPQLPTESDLAAPRQTLQDTLAKIEPGVTTRAEIESVFMERDGGPQGISGTRYYAEGVVIDVPYDQSGGTWTPTNRVSGPVTFHYQDRSSL